MNNELKLFLSENIDTIIELNKQIKNYNDKIDLKRNNVLEVLKEKFPKEYIEKYCMDKKNAIKPSTEKSDIYSCIYINFTINNIVLEPYLDYNGWHISVWKRASISSSMKYVESIRNYFISKGVKLLEQPKDDTRKCKVVLCEFPIDAETEVVANSIIEIMKNYVVPYLDSLK